MRNLIKKIFNPGTNSAFAFISLYLAIIPESLFVSFSFNEGWSDDIDVIVNRIVLGLITLIIANIIYWAFHNIRNQVSIDGRNYSIQIEYKNLMKIHKGKVLINFDECFTNKVGNSLEQIKDYSVCGQFLETHKDLDVKGIAASLGINPSTKKSKYLEKDRYDSGTIVPYENFLLLAFAKLNERGKAYMTYEEYITCLDKMWEEISYYHDKHDVYMPIVGSQITRFDNDLSKQELLDIIINSYRLSPWKILLPNKLHIVCNKNDKNKGFSLNDIYGVD